MGIGAENAGHGVKAGREQRPQMMRSSPGLGPDHEHRRDRDTNPIRNQRSGLPRAGRHQYHTTDSGAARATATESSCENSIMANP